MAFFLLSSLLCAVLSLGGVRYSAASMVDFDLIDVRSHHFDVDWGLSKEERSSRLKAFASTPIKGWNSYDGWDWVSHTNMDTHRQRHTTCSDTHSTGAEKRISVGH
jgi:hypothetical protein